MKYRRFGRTELAMPVISCGGMRYQYKWQDVKPSEIPAQNQANLEATIHRAFELGINHIETARRLWATVTLNASAESVVRRRLRRVMK